MGRAEVAARNARMLDNPHLAVAVAVQLLLLLLRRLTLLVMGESLHLAVMFNVRLVVQVAVRGAQLD